MTWSYPTATTTEGVIRMGSYVYCFTHARHPLSLDGLMGVGTQPVAPRAVRHGDLAAVVSDPGDGLRPKRRDLVAHEAVLESLGAAGTIVPMRFGTVAADDAAVRAELARGIRRYTDLLRRLDGHVELNVKGVHPGDVLLADVLAQHPELRERNAALRAAGGGSQPDRVAFGELVAAAVAQRHARDAGYAVAALRPHATEDRLGPPVEGCFVNASFLVALDARAGFDAAVARLRGALDGYAELRVSRPLPPYSFVADDGTRG
jgi:hypothetical protein